MRSRGVWHLLKGFAALARKSIGQCKCTANALLLEDVLDGLLGKLGISSENHLLMMCLACPAYDLPLRFSHAMFSLIIGCSVSDGLVAARLILTTTDMRSWAKALASFWYCISAIEDAIASSQSSGADPGFYQS